jgi:hypothetical protein
MNVRKGSSNRWQVVVSAENPARMLGSAERCEQDSSLKPILLLTSLLFLLIAPAPDARDIAEMSANFLIVKSQQGLMAAEEPAKQTEEELPR